MQPITDWYGSYWPLLLYIILAFGICAGMIAVSFFLGQRHREQATAHAYESGIEPTGDARLGRSVHFYIIAMFFVIFDLEAVFIFGWAISFRQTGWAAFVGISVFIAILLAVLIYEWRIGALDFAPSGKKILKNMKKQGS